MKKLKFALALIAVTELLYSQPEGNPACDSPNPPWWCDNDPAPIDSYLWVLFLAGVIVVMRVGWKKVYSVREIVNKG